MGVYRGEDFVVRQIQSGVRKTVHAHHTSVASSNNKEKKELDRPST